MIELVREFEALARWIEFRVIVQVTVGMAANIAEGLQIFIRLLSVTECEQVERYLTVCKFYAGIFEECVS